MELSFILSKQQENNRHVYWVMEMSEYLMDIKHIPGKKNVVANGLSQQGVHESYLVEVLAESYEPKLYAVYCMLTTGEMNEELPVLKESRYYVILGESLYRSMRRQIVKVPKIEECQLILSKLQAQPASKVPTKRGCDPQSNYLVT
ncbi:hypothetical protein DSO57_1016177 [Entomophthora muscae]|uniref:Uncharacterized protein n=1 Tax=Entomophthora muscae TaxID=34485 RepID=A0ACC2TFI5_9FUNG|nr:hypothetical protein DSO57_1016177 [Entomophthora muscae]